MSGLPKRHPWKGGHFYRDCCFHWENGPPFFCPKALSAALDLPSILLE
jgi:hypothetical protein